jgi:hypothetical protein
MPDHKTHHLVCKFFLGKARPDVDKFIDEPYRWLKSRHRILRHDPVTLFLKYHNDPEGFFAGLLHILTDFGVSEVKRHVGQSKRRNRKKAKRSARRQGRGKTRR